MIVKNKKYLVIFRGDAIKIMYTKEIFNLISERETKMNTKQAYVDFKVLEIGEVMLDLISEPIKE